MNNPAQKSYQLYIGGEWVDASDGGTLDVYCPANGEQLSVIADAHQGRRRPRGRRCLGGVRNLEQDHEGRARYYLEQGGRPHRRERREARFVGVAGQRQAHSRDARHRRGVLGRSFPLLRRRAAGRYGRGRHASGQHDVTRAARAHRRRRSDRAVELPVPYGGLEAGPRAGRRRLHGVQALVHDLAYGARAGEAHRGRHPGRRVQRGHGPRLEVGSVHPRQPEDQQAGLHRFHRSGPRCRSRSGRAPYPGHAGAGRQVRQHHLPRRQVGHDAGRHPVGHPVQPGPGMLRRQPHLRARGHLRQVRAGRVRGVRQGEGWPALGG